MDDHGPYPDRPHEDDVGGEIGQVRPAAQGVPPVLDHDRLAPEPADVRQRLDEDLGLGACGQFRRAHFRRAPGRHARAQAHLITHND